MTDIGNNATIGKHAKSLKITNHKGAATVLLYSSNVELCLEEGVLFSEMLLGETNLLFEFI